MAQLTPAPTPSEPDAQHSVLREQVVFVNARLDVPIARAAAQHIADHIALPTAAGASFVTSVSELASNILIHAGSGHVLVQAILHPSGRLAARVIARDRGPGIANLDRAFEDGFSTCGGLGGGLPGVKRLMDDVAVVSSPTLGTTVIATRFLASTRKFARSLACGIAHAPAPGCFVSGDAQYFDERDGTCLLAVLDGVGHGRRAADACSSALRLLAQRTGNDLPALLKQIHEGLRRTVGAAIGLFLVHPASGLATFAGVGNVRGRILGDREQHHEGIPGTLGSHLPMLRPAHSPYRPGDTLALFSDGISHKLSLAELDPLVRAQPQVAAQRLFDLHRLPTDDALILLAR